MIKEISIKNFRSIKADSISLEPFTVLIGANGSGKSNLVKALEFISEITTFPMDLAVSRQGGKDGICPKSIPNREIKNSTTMLSFKAHLPPPKRAPQEYKYVGVEYSLEFRFLQTGGTRVLKENIKFQDPLFLGNLLLKADKKSTVKENTVLKVEPNSFITWAKVGGKKPLLTANPIFDETNIHAYLSWFGFEELYKQVKSSDEMLKLVKAIQSRGSKKPHGQKQERLLMDPKAITAFDFSAHFRRFLTSIQSIKRYDLMLNELRREQPPSESPELSKTGANLPVALKKLAADEDAILRLKSSFQIIAPHISLFKPNSLKTGTEFIEFFESRLGRAVESWNTSDGTLRALAILVALESSKEGDLIVVEEPEQNMHPWAVRALIDHMRLIVKEKKVQIILTTHSEQVLERMMPDEVKVATRTVKDGTKFKTVTDLFKNDSLTIGDIGRLWVKGLLGGVPTVDDYECI